MIIPCYPLESGPLHVFTGICNLFDFRRKIEKGGKLKLTRRVGFLNLQELFRSITYFENYTTIQVSYEYLSYRGAYGIAPGLVGLLHFASSFVIGFKVINFQQALKDAYWL